MGKRENEERSEDLSVETRARLITELQRGRTSRSEEEAITRLFLGTAGSALTALKNAIEAGEDHRDLFALIFHDIDSETERARILDHFGSALDKRSDLKILSDIDDTLYSNWKDERYPKRNRATGKQYTYPGVRSFYRELDFARSPEPVLQDLTFLTARPGDRIGVGQGITRGHLKEMALGYAKILTGDFWHLLTHEQMAEKKYQSFIAYKKLFPEYDFVFCGDSGQGDVIAGGLMMEHPGSPMAAVFIHDVINTDQEKRAAYAARGVHFHDTYVGAAISAFSRGLLDAAAVLRVAEEAWNELLAIEFDSEMQKQARFAEHQRDRERALSLGRP